MRLAIVGGSGKWGCQVGEELRSRGHDVRRLSRRSKTHPVDLRTGAGLPGALSGCEIVIDASNDNSKHAAETLVGGSRPSRPSAFVITYASQSLDAIRYRWAIFRSRWTKSASCNGVRCRGASCELHSFTSWSPRRLALRLAGASCPCQALDCRPSRPRRLLAR